MGQWEGYSRKSDTEKLIEGCGMLLGVRMSFGGSSMSRGAVSLRCAMFRSYAVFRRYAVLLGCAVPLCLGFPVALFPVMLFRVMLGRIRGGVFWPFRGWWWGWRRRGRWCLYWFRGLLWLLHRAVGPEVNYLRGARPKRLCHRPLTLAPRFTDLL